MEMVYKKLEDIKPYINNPRDIEKAVSAVAESIKQCGYISPIVIDENGVILAGHTRYHALKLLGIKEVPVIVKSNLTEDQKRKYRILDNLTGELSDWDYEKLIQEIEGLDFENYDFGFNKLLSDLEKTDEISGGYEFEMEEFEDESFKHECPECGFKFN